MQAPHDQSLVVGLDRQLGVSAGPQDRPDLRRWQDHRARLLDFDAQHPVANSNLQVGSHEHRALIGFGDELDVLEDRLGAPGWNNPADHSERREQCLTVAQGPHSNPLISDCSRRGGREKCTAGYSAVFHPLPARRPGKHRSLFALSAEFRLGRFAGFE